MTLHVNDHGRPGFVMRCVRTRRVVPWLVALSCAACHSWKVAPLAAGQAVRWATPVRVILNTGEGFEFDSARVARDTLYGSSRHMTADSTVVIPVVRVVRVEARRFSEGRTFGMTLGVIALTAALAFAAFVAAWSAAWNDS